MFQEEEWLPSSGLFFKNRVQIVTIFNICLGVGVGGEEAGLKMTTYFVLAIQCVNFQCIYCKKSHVLHLHLNAMAYFYLLDSLLNDTVSSSDTKLRKQ